MASGFELTGTARSLLNIEVNTIVRDNMTGEPMPPVPHALLDVAGDYARTLCAFGIDLPAFFVIKIGDVPGAVIAWADNPASVSEQLTISAETFDRLRWAAKGAAQAHGPAAARITVAR